MKNVLGVIVGMVVGMIANMALIILNTVFYPLPEGMSMWKMEPEQLNEHIASLPQMAMILPLLAHLSQAFFGAWVAAKIGKSRPVRWSALRCAPFRYMEPSWSRMSW